MKDEQKILIVDDDPDIIEFVQYNLMQEGFKVISADNGVTAVEMAKKETPDLILLDVMMPEMDGIETCYKLKEIPQLTNTIIAFLTARSEDYSEISGLEAGADDYITKPIRPRVLVSKIKALLRRNERMSSTETVTASGITIDSDKYLIIKDGEEIVLPRKEFELLKLLFSQPGKVFVRKDILNTVWGSDVVVVDRTIDVHIRKLREKIGDSHIVTVKGVGYKFSE